MGAKHRLTFPAIAGGILLLTAVLTAYAQTGTLFVSDSGFDKHQRPPVPFAHDAHNETAGIMECNRCHHMYEQGKKLEYEASIGMECSACHLNGDSGARMDLISAYHRQCKGCHLERKAGPITCSQCHQKTSDTASAKPQGD